MSETILPADVLSGIGGGAVSPIRRGGSSAFVFRQRSASRDRFVKYQPHTTTAVDGHNSVDLVVKAMQINLIRATAPLLRPHIPAAEVHEFDSGIVFTQPYIPGRTMTEVLLLSGPIEFGRAVQDLLRVASTGYALRSSSPADSAYPYFGRAARRLGFLEANLRRTNLGMDPVAVLNWVDVASARLRAAKAQLSLLPEKFFFPVHGDLNLDNALESFAFGKVVLVDPRGTLEDWDPVYDLGKMLLSIWLHAGLERRMYWLVDDLILRGPQRSSPGLLGLVARPRHLVQLRAGLSEFYRAVLSWDFGTELDMDGERLWARVLFAAAVHAICEAACRLSVALSVPQVRVPEEGVKCVVYLAAGSSLLEQLLAGRLDSLPFPAASH